MIYYLKLTVYRGTILNNYDLLLNDTNCELTHHQNIANKIDHFQVIIIHDHRHNFFDYNYLINFPSENVRKKWMPTVFSRGEKRDIHRPSARLRKQY